MSHTKDGGPAYPCNMTDAEAKALAECGFTPHFKGGMSIRDYFAATCPITLADYDAGLSGGPVWTAEDRRMEDFTKARYRYADAMLAAREPAPSGERK